MIDELRVELKQTRPFRSARHEAALSVQRTAALLEHQFETALKPYRITATQYNVLRILRGAGESGLCRHEIGERMIRRVPDVTRLLDRLEDMRLVVRTRGGDDRRYVTTRITGAGLRLLHDLDPVVDGIHEQQLGHMPERRLRVLIALLTAVRQRP